MSRPSAILVLALLLSGCIDASSPDAGEAPDAGGDPEGRGDTSSETTLECASAPRSVSWQDGDLFATLTSDRGRWRFKPYPVGPSLPVSAAVREAWGAHNLTKVTWEMEHEEKWALHRELSLDGDRFLSAELEQRFSEEEVRAGFDSFLDQILVDRDADRDDLWMQFNRSRAEGDAVVVHRDDQGPPYWGHFFTYAVHLPDAMRLDVSSTVETWLDGKTPRDHPGASNGQVASTGPWRFQWDLEVRSVGFNDAEHEGHATLRVDANGGVTFHGSLWDEPDATGERWVSWMESILPETGARVPDRSELQFPAGSC